MIKKEFYKGVVFIQYLLGIILSSKYKKDHYSLINNNILKKRQNSI